MLQLVCPVTAEVIAVEIIMSARALASAWDKPLCLRCRTRCRNRRAGRVKFRDAYVNHVLGMVRSGLG